jgi:hypothetical protein
MIGDELLIANVLMRLLLVYTSVPCLLPRDRVIVPRSARVECTRQWLSRWFLGWLIVIFRLYYTYITLDLSEPWEGVDLEAAVCKAVCETSRWCVPVKRERMWVDTNHMTSQSTDLLYGPLLDIKLVLRFF